MLYFDTALVARLHVADPGFAIVRQLAAQDDVACSALGQVEVAAVFHRKFREGSISAGEFAALRAQFAADCQARVIDWLPASAAVLQAAVEMYETLSCAVFLRASDAIHLASARLHGFADIYSNDKHLLAAAPHVGLNGINPIGP